MNQSIKVAKVFFTLLGLFFTLYGADIPVLEEVYDSLLHAGYSEGYSSAPCDTSEPFVSFTRCFGDFDNDGADDIFVYWGIRAKFYDSTGDVFTIWRRYHFGIYSFKKKNYLVSGTTLTYHFWYVTPGDFDGDGKLDFLWDGEFFLGANSLYKKVAR